MILVCVCMYIPTDMHTYVCIYVHKQVYGYVYIGGTGDCYSWDPQIPVLPWACCSPSTAEGGRAFVLICLQGQGSQKPTWQRQQLPRRSSQINMVVLGHNGHALHGFWNLMRTRLDPLGGTVVELIPSLCPIQERPSH